MNSSLAAAAEVWAEKDSVTVAEMEEDGPWEGPESSSEPLKPKNGVCYLASCVLKGSAVLHAVKGHFRSPHSLDVVLGKETSIELVAIGKDGYVQSISEQSVFGIIKDLTVLSWNEEYSPIVQQGRDLLVALSDSGKVTFLSFCMEMDRFLPLSHIHLSNGGNSIHQLGRMLAVDPRGRFLLVSAYKDNFALLSVSKSPANEIAVKKILYPAENEVKAALQNDSIKTNICGTIWSMCFVAKASLHMTQNRYNPVIAMVMNREGAMSNDLLLFGCNDGEDSIEFMSLYNDSGPLALSITEVPHNTGFAVLFRMGDILLMDLSDPKCPSCFYRISLNFSSQIDEMVEPYRNQDIDEGISASALLELSGDDMVRQDEPNLISCTLSQYSKHVCSFSWEPNQLACSKLVFCLDTGEFYMLEIDHLPEGVRVNVHGALYKGLPCKVLLWMQDRQIAAFVEMGDGVILEMENGKLSTRSQIQNIAPIFDMSFVNNNDEKQDLMFACCGVDLEGSLRIIQNGISIERHLKTTPIYQGVTGIWALQMKVSDANHSLLVLSFVEETRVLSVGLSFVDVSDAVGFRPNACTLACGLLADGMLVQVQRDEVRLCLPKASAYLEGVPLSAPACTSWRPSLGSICLGAVGENMIVIATSSPCCMFILEVRSLPGDHYEIYEVHRLGLSSELSCINIPSNTFNDHSHCSQLPDGLKIGKTIVVGTHKPTVEVLLLVPGKCIRCVAIGTVSINNALGLPLVGCIPQDVRFVLADRCYILSGLRNGMLLRFEWPAASSATLSSEPVLSANHSDITDNSLPGIDSPSVSLQHSHIVNDGNSTIDLQIVAIRQIGITPVFLVPLNDSLDSDIIVLSERPWLLHASKHSLVYSSIAFQTATHATPVRFAECPNGILFVVGNSLLLVEIVQNKRLNVQKFGLGGTPRKILYHKESRTLLVMRIGLAGDSCASDICRIDPSNGSLLSRFKFLPGETAKCMELIEVANEQLLLVGTSQTAGHAMMPSGEAESAKGRLIVISLDNVPNSDILYFNSSTASQVSSPFRETFGHGAELLSGSLWCSSPDIDFNVGFQHEETCGRQLKLITSKTFSGVVLSVCSFLDRYFLVSSGNILSVFGFASDGRYRLRRYGSTRTRFTITSVTTYMSRIAVSDCRDGVLFYMYQEDQRKLEQFSCDPVQRLVADCVLLDVNTAATSDRRGHITFLTSVNDSEDDRSPECNLILSCSYYVGETAMALRKGSFLNKLNMEDGYRGCNDAGIIPNGSCPIVATTLLGSVLILIPISSDAYESLKVVQDKLAIHRLTAPILGNDHAEFRRRGSLPEVPTILDGDMLSQFLELTKLQQEAVLATTVSPSAEVSSSCGSDSVSVVVQLLEQIYHALS